MQLPSFDREKFRAVLTEIRTLTIEQPKIIHQRLTELCQSAGVAFLVVKELPKVGANGATRWLHTDNPLIQLNLKWKWADIFWFTFFHEAAHVMQPKRHDIMHYGKRQSTDPLYEADADQFASDMLIPPNQWRHIKHEVDLCMSRARIEALAQEVGIAPGIVVGHLQHERIIHHSEMNDLRTRYEWRG